MRLIKIALGNVNPTVGAVRSNVDRVLAQAREMAADGVTVGCFTEQVVGGYPTEDLIQWRAVFAAPRGGREGVAEGGGGLSPPLGGGGGGGGGGEVFHCAAGAPGRGGPGFVPPGRVPPPHAF